MSVEKIGRYEITGELGKGAMGVVYKAVDPNIGRAVALKTMRVDIHGDDREDMVRRFQNEARAAGVLSHPNIVTIYDAGEDNGVFYIAMEFCEGKTLGQLLAERKTLLAPDIVEIGTQICAGLQYAHFRKVIHRDIKPPNIMLPVAGGVKILDFGIAKAGASLTNTGEVMGTPHYMSPEQVRGRELDGRTDIFSTGVVLYEMLTGERPFTGQNVTTVIYKIVNEKVVPPRELDVTIHPGMSQIISKCLAKNPDDRYQEAGDLATALKSYKIISTPDIAMNPSMSLNVSGPNHTAVMTRPMPVLTPTVATQPVTAARAATGTQMAPATPTLAIPAVPAPAPASPARRPLMLFGAIALSLLAVAAVIGAVRRPKSPVPSAAVTPTQTTPAPVAAQPVTTDDRIAEITREPSPGTATRTEPRTPAATAEIGVGELRVTSNPSGAQVSIDGVTQDYYITPFNAPPMKAGTHQLTVTAAGFPAQSRQVEVLAHKKSSADFQLAGDNAIFNVSSEPSGAEIIIDGNPSGYRTPTQLPLKAGQHRIAFRLDGFDPVELTSGSAPGETVNLAPRLRARNSVEITGASAGDNQSLGALARMHRLGNNADVPDGKGAVVVRTRPKGVTIMVDGVLVPRPTPTRFPLRPGSYRVVLQKDGFQSVTRIVQVEEGKIIEIDELLLPQQ